MTKARDLANVATNATDAANALPETIINAAGDLIYGTANDTASRLAIGTAGQVLTVNSGATAPEWGTIATGGKTWTLLNTGGTALTGAATVTVSGIDAEDLMIIISGASTNSSVAYTELRVRFNTDTNNNYFITGPNLVQSTTWGQFSNLQMNGIFLTEFQSAADLCGAYIRVEGCKSTGIKTFHYASGTDIRTNSRVVWNGGYYNASAAITSVSVNVNNGNLDAGTIYIYGA